jgi:DNA (cytosine-5)-methyltransferase 1
VVALQGAAPAHRAGESPFHSRAVKAAAARLPAPLAKRWVWWRLAAPPTRNIDLAAILEPDAAVAWHPPERTAHWLGLMAPLHRQRLDARIAHGARAAGAIFRRTRRENGCTAQRAEVRFDGLAGCLRTPRGGSSRQAIVVAEHGQARTRLLTAREAARLMGLPDSYRLPKAATAALHVAGDGVAVPVVRWLARELLEPLLGGAPELRPCLAAGSR